MDWYPYHAVVDVIDKGSMKERGKRGKKKEREKRMKRKDKRENQHKHRIGGLFEIHVCSPRFFVHVCVRDVC